MRSSTLYFLVVVSVSVVGCGLGSPADRIAQATKGLELSTCGGLVGGCPGAHVCVDKADACDPAHGADCPGVCVAMCEGLAGFACPTGLECVRDPAMPASAYSGADYSGLCVSACGGAAGLECLPGYTCQAGHCR